jgi:hypothetical protein
MTYYKRATGVLKVLQIGDRELEQSTHKLKPSMSLSYAVEPRVVNTLGGIYFK